MKDGLYWVQQLKEQKVSRTELLKDIEKKVQKLNPKINGFVTFDLPGERVWGVDISKNAIAWAKEKAKIMQDSKRYEFLNASLFDIPQINIGLFDLIVITGVLYSQYIGNSRILSNMIIDSILNKGGILVSCHIEDWSTGRFPYSTIDTSVYKYREYFHKLEVQACL